MKTKRWILISTIFFLLICGLGFGVRKAYTVHYEKVNAYYLSVKNNESFLKQQKAFYNSATQEMLRNVGAKPGEIEKMNTHFYDFNFKRRGINYSFIYQGISDYVYSVDVYESDQAYKKNDSSLSFIVNSRGKADVLNNPQHFDKAQQQSMTKKGIAAYNYVMKKVYENWPVEK